MTQKKNKQQGGMRIPRNIIRLGKFLQFFSSDLTVKYVRYLFQKPIRHKMPEAEKSILQEAHISYLDLPEIHKTIAVYKWENGPKKALIIHGWSGRATQMYKIVNALLSEGYTVFSFDAPAHGKSTGNKTMMPEFIKAIETVSETFGPFDIAVGHSMGGISLLNVQGKHEIFNKIVVLGTPDSIYNIFNEFVSKLELKPLIAKKLIAVFEKVSGQSIFDFHGSKQTQKIKAPTLIIHDEADKEVPITDALNNYKYLKNGTFLKTKGLGHNRILKNNEVIKKILEFSREN